MASQPAAPYLIPAEVKQWIKSVFAEVNRRTSNKLTRIPTIHETSLDLTVIEQISQFASPFRFVGGWLVSIDTHYLGGGRHFGEWEIADLGVLVIFRKGRIVQRTKLGLLQSKRLYPDELTVDAEDHPVDYMIGFGRLLHSDSEFASAIRERTFNFSNDSRFRALEYDGKQYRRILEYQTKEKIPVHCLFYNPLRVPSAATIPVTAGEPVVEQSCDVGCRIMAMNRLHEFLHSRRVKSGYNPSYSDIVLASSGLPEGSVGGWRLEHFIVDLLMGCQEGYVGGINPMQDRGLERVFFARTAPISAAISITIDSPAG